MRIDTLTVQNFRSIKDLTISFDKGVNLFVGNNGSGKTTILEAINVALGGFFGGQETKMQRMIYMPEVRLEIKENKLHRCQKTTISAYSGVVGGEWVRNFNANTENNDKKNVRLASSYGNTFFDAFLEENNRNIAPLIAYYSTKRLFKDASQSAKQKYDAAVGRKNGYLQCLKDDAIKGTLEEWLGNAVTKRATKAIKGIDDKDLILENVEAAIKKTLAFMFDDFDEKTLKIFQDPDFENSLFLQIDDNNSLPLSYYSDGFRNLIYLIIDLIWRASQLNPFLSLEQIIQQQNGVVCIDEIDLHLHPKWQAKAIPLIQELLPNVQFFVTTHSPTVVANFENGGLYVISKSTDNVATIEKYTNPYFGKQINTILRDVLGARDRHKPTQDKLDKLFRLIDENKKEEYEPLLKELKILLGDDDFELRQAEVIIDWQTNED